jgi:hypothetical protein
MERSPSRLFDALLADAERATRSATSSSSSSSGGGSTTSGGGSADESGSYTSRSSSDDDDSIDELLSISRSSVDSAMYDSLLCDGARARQLHGAAPLPRLAFTHRLIAR